MTKHLRYMSYIARHKFFVLLAGLLTGANLWRLLIHDWSKLLPSEWLPYTRFFYGDYPSWNEVKEACPGYSSHTKESVSSEFDAAWLRHIHRNDHHWQFWVLREDSGNVKCLEMPEAAVREMVADWMGAGRAITGRWRACEWYRENEHKMQLHPTTRQRVVEILTAMSLVGMA